MCFPLMLILASLPYFPTDFFLTSNFNSWKEIWRKCHLLKCTNNIYKLLLSHKKNEIMPFTAMWMDLEMATVSKVNPTNLTRYHLSVGSEAWRRWTYPQNINRLTDSEGRRVEAAGARARGRCRAGVWDQQREAVIDRMGKQRGPTVQHSELYSNHNEKDMKRNVCVHVC